MIAAFYWFFFTAFLSLRSEEALARPLCILSGQVTDEQQKPLPAVTIYAYPYNSYSPGVVTMHSDSQGNFQTALLPAGRYQLSWHKPRYYALSKFQRNFNAVDVDLSPAKPQHIDLKMSVCSFLQVRVFDPANKPLAKHKVFFISRNTAHIHGGMLRRQTDAQGYYHESFEGDFVGDEACFVPGVGYAGYQEYNLIRGKTTEIAYHLAPGATVEGTVFTPDGKTPLQNASIRVEMDGDMLAQGPFGFQDGVREIEYEHLYPFPTSQARTYMSSVTPTGRDGRFHLLLLPTGECRLTATGLWMESKPLVVRLTGGMHLKDVRLVLSEPTKQESKK